MTPRDIHIADYCSISPDGEGIVTNMNEARDRSTGEVGAVIGYTYEVAIPSRRFEKIRLTVNGAALIEPDFFKNSPTAHVKITDVKDFIGKWYRLKGETEYRLSCKASGFTVVKEEKRV